MSREFPKNNPPENTSPKIALPTVGRIVHVFGTWEDGVPADVPRAAMVTAVVDGLIINAAVWSSKGEVMGTPDKGVLNIPHLSLPRDAAHAYWDWMDYQKGQAAKTERLEERIDQMKAAHVTDNARTGY